LSGNIKKKSAIRKLGLITFLSLKLQFFKLAFEEKFKKAKANLENKKNNMIILKKTLGDFVKIFDKHINDQVVRL
jgi:hypothetical protein